MKAFVLCLGLIQAELVCDYGENCEEYCDDDICEYRNEFSSPLSRFYADVQVKVNRLLSRSGDFRNFFIV